MSTSTPQETALRLARLLLHRAYRSKVNPSAQAIADNPYAAGVFLGAIGEILDSTGSHDVRFEIYQTLHHLFADGMLAIDRALSGLIRHPAFAQGLHHAGVLVAAFLAPHGTTQANEAGSLIDRYWIAGLRRAHEPAG